MNKDNGLSRSQPVLASNGQAESGLSGTERLFWGEVANPRSTQRSVAVCYAVLIGSGHASRDAEFWPRVHTEIMRRFGFKNVLQVDPIKKAAWQIFERCHYGNRAPCRRPIIMSLNPKPTDAPAPSLPIRGQEGLACESAQSSSPNVLGEVEGRLDEAYRRFGGLPKLARTPQGRKVIVRIAANEVIARCEALERAAEGYRERIVLEMRMVREEEAKVAAKDALLVKAGEALGPLDSVGRNYRSRTKLPQPFGAYLADITMAHCDAASSIASEIQAAKVGAGEATACGDCGASVPLLWPCNAEQCPERAPEAGS